MVEWAKCTYFYRYQLLYVLTQTTVLAQHNITYKYPNTVQSQPAELLANCSFLFSSFLTLSQTVNQFLSLKV